MRSQQEAGGEYNQLLREQMRTYLETMTTGTKQEKQNKIIFKLRVSEQKQPKIVTIIIIILNRLLIIFLRHGAIFLLLSSAPLITVV